MPDINGIPYVESTDLVSAYPAVSLALAQELDDQLAAKVDFALPTNAQNGSGASAYTFALADARRLTVATNAGTKTFTIPPQSSVTWLANTIIRVANYGAGALTIAGGSGVTVTNAATTLAQFQSAALIRTGSDAWTLLPFGGGGIKAAGDWAQITGHTGTSTSGTYSSGGVTWSWRQWTGSGSVTTTAGIVDVLIVGGGGSGQVSANGGTVGYGGAGAVLDGIRIVTAGTHTVAVGGAGGASAFFGRTAGAGGPGFAAWLCDGGDNGRSITSAGNGSPGGAILFNSAFGATGGGAGGGNSGFSSSITGSAYSYGIGGSGSPSGNFGSGGGNGAGAQGTVVIRVAT